MNILPIIQARLTSTRLPGKTLKKLGNKSILRWQIDTLKKIFNMIIIAIPDNKENRLLCDIANDYIKIFKGDENNVLKRILDAAHYYNVDYIMRICSDNPFIQYEFLLQLKQHADKGNYDYISYYDNSTNCITSSYGFFAEVFSYKKAMELYEKTNKYDKEHVTPIFYKYNNANISIKKIPMPLILKQYPFLRFTLDNDYDLRLFEIIVNKYPQDYYSYKDLINIVKQDRFIMKSIKENYIRGAK